MGSSRMVLIEVGHNPNCVSLERVFHELEPPRAVSRVRCERTPGDARWCDVTGWTASGTPCPAWIQKVEDSGEGVAFLLYGGDGGLRFRPTGTVAPWRIDEPSQWGEPLRLLANLADVH